MRARILGETPDRLAGVPLATVLRDRRVWLIAAAAVAIQVVYAIVANPATNLGDQVDYLATGDRFMTWWREPQAYILRTPGYPLFLSVLLNLGGGVTLVKAAQMLALGLAVVAVAAMAAQVGGLRAGRLAAGLIAAYVPLLTFSTQILTEALSVSLFVVGIASLLQAIRATEVRWAPAAAAMTLFTTATLVRPNFAVLSVAAAALLVVAAPGSRNRAVAVAVVLVPVLVLFGPWVGRNVALTGKPSPLGSGEKFPVALGVHLPFDTDVGQFSTYRRSVRFFSDTRPDGFSEEEANALEPWDELWSNVTEQPGDLLWTRAVGQAQLWLWPVTARVQYNRGEVVPYPLLMAYHLVLLLGGIAGVVLLRPTLTGRVIGATVVLIAAVHLVSFPQPRYALPAIPLLAVATAAAAVARAGDRRGSGAAARSGAAR